MLKPASYFSQLAATGSRSSSRVTVLMNALRENNTLDIRVVRDNSGDGCGSLLEVRSSAER